MSCKTWKFTLESKFTRKHAPDKWKYDDFKVNFIWCGKTDFGEMRGIVQFDDPMKFFQAYRLCPFAMWVGNPGNPVHALHTVNGLPKYYEGGVFTKEEDESNSKSTANKLQAFKDAAWHYQNATNAEQLVMDLKKYFEGYVFTEEEKKSISKRTGDIQALKDAMNE